MVLLLIIAGILSLLLALGVQLYAQQGGAQLAGFLGLVGLACWVVAALIQVRWLFGLATP